jgi:pimeloyl-ACP methyl ester carboxylesterase
VPPPAAAAPARPRLLLTADGVRIEAVHSPPDSSADLAVVIAHGFTGSWRRPAVRALARWLRPYAGVLSFDFRGHGRSDGLSTVGDLEVLDLDVVVRWARALGYARVVVTGWSMGASVGVRHAALLRGVDGVVAVSGPSRWHYRGTVPMRWVHRAIHTRAGRAYARARLGTRIAREGWDAAPDEPRAVAGLIAPVPVLVVHGDADAFFPVEHAYELYDAARDPRELWVVPGFGHAEAAAGEELVGRIGAWAAGVPAGTWA